MISVEFDYHKGDSLCFHSKEKGEKNILAGVQVSITFKIPRARGSAQG